MAQLVNAQITIGGNEIRHYSSFQLTQDIFSHHVFRLVCPAESLDGTTGKLFNSSKDLMGATFTAQVDSVEAAGALKFSGVVTQVEAARFASHHGDIIITGYSPTIILDSGPHCKSWEKKAVKNIAQDVLKHFPQNLLNPKVAPLYGETLPYTVQYKETAWQFLQRLCSVYGEWLFYDGQKLVIGPPASSEKASLVFGSNLSRFNMALQVRPTDRQVFAWDANAGEVRNSTTQGIEDKAGLDEMGKHVHQASKTVFGSTPKSLTNTFISNQSKLEEAVNVNAAMQSSNYVRFNGNSGHPGVTIGGQVEVQGQNIFSGIPESYGTFIVISANHFIDSQGNYNNDFIAIPASIKYPPVTAWAEPRCETQSAVVTDNNDPRGLGRVRVKYHWMNGAEKSPWIRVATPHAGGGKGVYFIPEIGEEMVIAFEGASPTKPYALGAVYNGKATNPFANPNNDIKTLQTRSGCKIVFNDQEKSITISDPSENVVVLDGKGNISISSPTSISLKSKDISITATNNVTISATENLVESGKVVGISAETDLTATGKKVMVNGTAQLTLDSPELNANGTKTTVAGTTIGVNGSADVSISGGLVKINS